MQDYPPRLLMDTNILLLLLVGSCDRSLIGRFKRVRQFAPEDFDLLENVAAQASRLVVTPHILTEADNLARQLPQNYHPILATILKGWGNSILDERHVPLRSIADLPEFQRLGLADGTMFLLDELTVLSDDSRLVDALLRRGVFAVNFNHLRPWMNP